MVNRRTRSAAVGFFQDFKDFMVRGNVIDIAVAVIIAGAFAKIVDSFIFDVITPGLLQPALKAAQVEEIAKLSFSGVLYGKFLATLINFIVIAFVIFVFSKFIEKFRRKREQEVSAPDPQARLISALERLAEQMETRAED